MAGQTLGGAVMEAAAAQADSAGVGLKRAREGAQEVKDEVERLALRRIETGWRGSAAATPVAHCLGSGSGSSQSELEDEEGNGEWIGMARRADKSGARRARFAGILDAWSRRRCRAGRGMGVAYEHSGTQEETVIVLTEF